MKNRIKWVMVCAIVFLCYGCAKQEEAKLVDSFLESQMTIPEAAIPEEPNLEISEEQMYYVYVCGAVKCPGVYELPKSSRVNDALVLAGGFTQEANETYVNLAEAVTDGQKIYIPTYEECIEQEKREQEDAKININTASKEVLMTLPGIGEAKAESIISFRSEQGKFESIEDIMQIPGIKESVFSKIKELITTG